MKNNCKEITIVTAFFDIGRASFSGKPRSNDVYAEYFRFWAKIKNRIVVYTDSVMAEKVKEIRNDYNLLDKTEIIIIDDVSSLEPKFLKRLELIDSTDDFKNYRYMDNSADNNPKYNYIMFLKSWCVNDAVKKGYAKGHVAWLDFGFNHGGKIFYDENDFDYLWKAPVCDDKITVFSLRPDDNKPIFRIIESYEVYMMGAPFIVPDFLASKFWELIKASMNSLLDCGFMDDDQTLMLMAYRKEPSIFDVRQSTWFMPLKECGGSHLKIKISNNAKHSLKDKLLYKYRVNKRNKNHFKRLKKIFYKDYLD